jgi:glycosyltransferase involved in cell wall biosynthesis
MSDSSAHPQITQHHLRSPRRGEPMIVAIFSFRYDAHLVPDLIENIKPVVHGYAAWDDRGDHGYHSNEPERRNALNATAIAMGADWILGIDPDERLERRSAERIAEIARDPKDKVIGTFHLREMFSATQWRSDGIWGQKTQNRLYPRHAVRLPLGTGLHGHWCNPGASSTLVQTGLNLYHLNCIAPARSVQRRHTYASIDPERRYQSVGYDYLCETDGMELVEITPERGFDPPHVDDGELWGPERSRDGLLPDPPAARLRLLQQTLEQGGLKSAWRFARKLADQSPGDADLATAAVRLEHFAALTSDRAEVGDLWRRWAPGEASVSEGAEVAKAEMVVIVIGFRAREDLGAAVRSLLAQEPRPEIVVINSGGGPAREKLADVMTEIRLIEVEDPLPVGAVRNIGIDASSAPLLAFLAGDCLARPDWIANRLLHHSGGALSVSTPVVSSEPASLRGQLMDGLKFPQRRPDRLPTNGSHFGRSYKRSVFKQAGYFSPVLNAGEDTEFNQRVNQLESPVWAADVITEHKEVPSLLALFRDLRRRARVDAAGRFGRGVDEDALAGRLAEFSGRAYAATYRMRAERGRFAAIVFGLATRLMLKANAQGLKAGAVDAARSEQMRVKARLLAMAGDPEAQEAAKEAMQLRPDDWLAQHEYATTLGKTDAAGQAFRRALELRPAAGEPVAAATKMFLAMGQIEHAAAFVDYALLLSPKTSSHYRQAAIVAQAKGETAEALDHARQALALGPADPANHQLLADMHRASGASEIARLREKSLRDLRRT